MKGAMYQGQVDDRHPASPRFLRTSSAFQSTESDVPGRVTVHPLQGTVPACSDMLIVNLESPFATNDRATRRLRRTYAASSWAALAGSSLVQLPIVASALFSVLTLARTFPAILLKRAGVSVDSIDPPFLPGVRDPLCATDRGPHVRSYPQIGTGCEMDTDDFQSSGARR